MRKEFLLIPVILFIALLWAFPTGEALAQDDMVVTNLTGLAQQAFSANHCLNLPWVTACQYLGLSLDGALPWWLDCSQVPCDLLAAATNLNTSPLTQGVPMVGAVLTKTVNTGEVTVQPDVSTNIAAVIAAPDGYEPGTCPEDAAIWRAYQGLTNCPTCWGIEGDIPPLTVSVHVYLADVANYGLYQSNLSSIDAQAAAAAAQASSTPTFAMGGGFMPMDDDDMDGGDPCVITNYSIPFSIVSIAPDGGGDIILRWQSCTDAVYIVQSESSLTPTSSWTDVAWMFGTDQETSWTDTKAPGLTQNFYQVARGNPTNTNTGIPWWWIVSEGAGDPLDPNLASEVSTNPWAHGLTNLQVYQNPSVLIANNYSTVGDGIPDWWKVTYGFSLTDPTVAGADPAGDGINNLQKYEYGLNPQVAYTLDVVVNGGSVWASNQTITLDATGFPFPFLEVSLQPTMTDAVLLANNGVPLAYALPSTTNTTYYLYLQYTDASTNALGPVLFKPVTLDTIPPWVEITSPTNGTAGDAFVHLQATVYDPDPQNPSAPGVFRPVKIWINGQRYWNLSNHQIDIPRYPVAAYSNNVITILAQDQAGNTTQAGVSIYINPTNTAPPTLTLTGFAPNTVTDLPDESNVWVSGQMDDLNAIVTASVNGGDPISMNVRSNRFGYMLPIDWGTNTVVIMGANAAGYVSSNVFTLVCGNRYQFAFTTPAPGTYVNNSNVQVSGTVSEFRDAGLPTQTGVVSVVVNSVGTTLSTNGGIVSFTTTNALPVPADGSALVLNAVVTWADGSTDPTAEAEGYIIIAERSTSNIQEDWTWNCGNSSGYDSEYQNQTFTFSDPGANNNSVTLTHTLWSSTDCSGQPSSGESDETNVCTWSQPGSGMYFGCLANGKSWYDSPGAWNESYSRTDYSDEEMTVVPPWNYAPGTWVELTFWDLSYGTAYGPPPDLSNVTYQGEAPIPGQPGSYLVQMSGDTPFTISAGSFGWPSAYSSVNNAPYFYWTTSEDDLSFSYFSNQQLLPLIQISNMSQAGSKNPGAAVVCNCDSNSPTRQQFFVSATTAPPGTSVTLTIPSNLKVFTAPTGGAQVSSGTSLSILSTNLWAEGAQVSSAPMDSRISAQINGSGPSDHITFTVIWATMTYMTSGTDPADAPGFEYDVPGGTALGAQFTNGQSAAWGKMCTVATVSPAGVHAYFSNGWNLVQQVIGTSFSNGVVNPAMTHTTWTNDGPDAAFETTFLDDADKLYATDAPNIAGFGASSSYETYFNFYDYATWNTQRCCSTNSFWHWRARWKADQTPQVTTADVNNGMITIPTSPYYPPP